MKRWTLSHRDSADMIQGIEDSLGVRLDLAKSTQALCAEPEGGVVFVTLDGMEFVQAGGKFIPFLGSPQALGLFPEAVVDDGAIKFLLNGADVMRPGIRKLGEWGPSGRLVVVREEKKGRAIAVGVSTVPSEEARTMRKGSCLKNIHHVGDRYWSLHKSL
jgi:predicted RNA-binding protein (TIGR00451 family)